MRARELRKWVQLLAGLRREERAALKAEIVALEAIDAGAQIIEEQAPRCCPHCMGGTSPEMATPTACSATVVTTAEERSTP